HQFLIARFEDVKRQRRSRKQHHLQRKQGQKVLLHATIMAFRPAGGNRNMRLEDKVVLITGGSEGIGASCAEAFRRRGARLSLVARSREKLERAGGPEAVITAGDLCDPETRHAAVQSTLNRFGRIDVLLNSAGAGLYA